MKNIPSQNGSIFAVLFGSVLVVGILGLATSTFIKGPLQTAVKTTRQNAAETQMGIAGQVSVMSAAAAANNGDCDTDTFVEPLEYRAPAGKPAPTGGGLIPDAIGINKIDPWGMEYGYCVWDHGPTVLNATCQTTTPGTNLRLAGANARIYPVVAIVSAGADKIFSTTCRSFATADANSNGVLTDSGDAPLVGKNSDTDDDIIMTYTYDQAGNAAGGNLWTLKSDDPTKAQISKNLEVTGAGTFSGTGTFEKIAATGANFLEVLSGLTLANPTQMANCNATNKGVVRRMVNNTGLEICDGTAWQPISSPVTQYDCTGLGNASYNDPVSGHCYYRVDTATTYDAAQSSCQSNGAYLTAISSAAENTTVYNLLGANPGYFIGADDRTTEGEWRWNGGELNGIQFWQGAGAGNSVNGAYTNWNTGNPNDAAGAQDEGIIMAASGAAPGKWDDATNGGTRPYVCEKGGGESVVQANCTGLGTGSYNDPGTGHCYYKTAVTANWSTAQSNCQANGGYLAVISSATEKNLIYSKPAIAPSGSEQLWFGASDAAVEGEWRWQGGELAGVQFWSGNNTGSAVNGAYSSWGASNPNDGSGNEDCGTLQTTGWNDGNCSTATFLSLCEKDQTTPVDDNTVVNQPAGPATDLNALSDTKINYPSYNMMVGENTGNASISGTGNTALGVSTLPNVTIASANTALGYNNFNKLTDSSNNVGIGSNTGSNFATTSGFTLVGSSIQSNPLVIGGGGEGRIMEAQ